METDQNVEPQHRGRSEHEVIVPTAPAAKNQTEAGIMARIHDVIEVIVFGDRKKKKRIAEKMEEFKKRFNVGDYVRVKFSNGNIETGWMIFMIEPGKNKVIIRKNRNLIEYNIGALLNDNNYASEYQDIAKFYKIGDEVNVARNNWTVDDDWKIRAITEDYVYVFKKEVGVGTYSKKMDYDEFLSLNLIGKEKPQERLKHHKYTEYSEGTDDEPRFEILSNTAEFDGGVFTHGSKHETGCESIVVDTKKDHRLLNYIHEISDIVAKMGRRNNIDDYIDMIFEKIMSDFEYSYRMLNKDYSSKTYPSGQKFVLGIFMKNNDLVCRHMSLLAAVTLEHLKRIYPEIFGKIEVRNMADMQLEVDSKGKKKSGGGHAYTALRIEKEGGIDYMVIDAAAQKFTKLRELIRIAPSGLSKTDKRHFFSMLRFLFQRKGEMTEDERYLVAYIFYLSEKSLEVANILNDVRDILKGASKRGEQEFANISRDYKKILKNRNQRR